MGKKWPLFILLKCDASPVLIDEYMDFNRIVISTNLKKKFYSILNKL